MALDRNALIYVKLNCDTGKLLDRLKRMSEVNLSGVMNAIAEGLRTSTIERFGREESPEGTKWKPSIRAREEGGKTLTKTTALKTSIRAKADSGGASVGTNDIRAATLQFGDKRTISAKNKKYLRFRVGGGWKSAVSVKINIPARPFLGISKEDEQEIKDVLVEALKE